MSKKAKARKDASARVKKLEDDNFRIRQEAKKLLELAEKKALDLQNEVDRLRALPKGVFLRIYTELMMPGANTEAIYAIEAAFMQRWEEDL